MSKQTLDDTLKWALVKDYHALYQKEYTSDWREQRLLRELEMVVLGLDYLKQAIMRWVSEEVIGGNEQDKRPQSREDVVDNFTVSGRNDLRHEQRDKIEALASEAETTPRRLL